jgi:hypothetical protein
LHASYDKGIEYALNKKAIQLNTDLNLLHMAQETKLLSMQLKKNKRKWDGIAENIDKNISVYSHKVSQGSSEIFKLLTLPITNIDIKTGVIKHFLEDSNHPEMKEILKNYENHKKKMFSLRVAFILSNNKEQNRIFPKEIALEICKFIQ